MKQAGLFLGVALLVAACSAPAPVETVPDASAPAAGLSEPGRSVKSEMDALDRVEDTCGLDALKPYLGKQASDIPADVLPERSRIVGPDTQVTMDYVPTRVNVLTDEAGMVIGLKCG